MLTSLTIQYMRSMMRMRERMKVSSRQQWPSKLNPWLFLSKNNHDGDDDYDDDDENDENVNNDDDHFTCTAPLRCVCEVSSSGRASPPKGSVGEHHFDFKFLDEDDKDDHREW